MNILENRLCVALFPYHTISYPIRHGWSEEEINAAKSAGWLEYDGSSVQLTRLGGMLIGGKVFTHPTSGSFAYFSGQVRKYAVELYLSDNEGEPLSGYDYDDLTPSAVQTIDLVSFQFWMLTKDIIDTFLEATDGEPSRKDENTLDQFAAWFAAAWGGHGIGFTDTILTAQKTPDQEIWEGRDYDENENQQTLEKIATTYFYGECSLYVTVEEELELDCEPSFTLKWAGAGHRYRLSPAVTKL